MKKILLLGSLAIAGAALGILFGVYQLDSKNSGPADPVLVQARLSGIHLPDVDRKIRNGEEWLGKIVIVNHWAAWCPPCLEEIPMLIEYQNLMAKEGVQVVGIAHDQLESTLRFGDQIGINYPSLIAVTDGNKLLKDHGNTNAGALPFTAIFNKDGDLVRTALGKLTYVELDRLIQPLL
ncbi:MAG: TlpA disulfide reductase family protein [Gammaproteobacteria bacterium]|nr:TlpA disulfide reductase family protein [Gammaproteobacteria bacterium]